MWKAHKERDKMYKITARFQDVNMPAWNSTARTIEAAMSEAAHIQRTFAALKSIAIESPEGAKLVYNGAGIYQFTIPAGVL
jgi:hypothetical protein